VCRAENPEALYSDFRAIIEPETLPFDEVQNSALESMKSLLIEANDINSRHEELDGATWLWKAAEQGHYKAVHEILKHPDVDPNMACKGVCTTPLYIASYHGHEEVVKMLLKHSRIGVNTGKTDLVMSPLIVAAQEGREVIVKLLLGAIGVDVNQAAVTDGVTPLCMACAGGHESVVDMLLKADGIEIDRKLKDGTRALALAANHGHVKILEAVVSHVENFRSRSSSESGAHYCEAASAWAKEKRIASARVPSKFSLHSPSKFSLYSSSSRSLNPKNAQDEVTVQ
jgi:ankyrin repeat protein